MIHFLAPFDPFKPARLVFGHGPRRSPSGGGGGGKKTPEEDKDKELTPAEKEKEMEARTKFEKIDKAFYERLKPKTQEIKDFIEAAGRGDFGSPDSFSTWQSWGSEFADVVRDLFEEEGERMPADKLVRSLQKVIFRNLGVEGYQTLTKVAQHKLNADGILGPDTLTALALYMNVDLPELAYESGGQTKAKSSKDSILSGHIEYADKEQAVEAMRAIGKDKLYEMYRGVVESDEAQMSGMLDTDLFYEKIDDVIIFNEGRFDATTTDGWRKAFQKAGISNEDIEKMGLNPFEQDPAAAEKAKKAAETKEKARRRVKIKSAVDAFKRRIEQRYYRDAVNEKSIREDLRTVKTHTISWFTNDLDNIPVIEGKWREFDRLYSDYERALKTGTGWERLEKEKDAAYEDLKRTIDKYFNGLKEQREKVVEEYASELEKIASKYSFPKGVRVEEFVLPQGSQYINSETWRNWNRLSGHFYPSKFKKPRGPNHDIQSKNDLEKLVIGETPRERAVNRDEMWNLAARYGSPLDVLNSKIYSGNALSFAREHNELINNYLNIADNRRKSFRNEV